VESHFQSDEIFRASAHLYESILRGCARAKRRATTASSTPPSRGQKLIVDRESNSRGWERPLLDPPAAEQITVEAYEYLKPLAKFKDPRSSCKAGRCTAWRRSTAVLLRGTMNLRCGIENPASARDNALKNPAERDQGRKDRFDVVTSRPSAAKRGIQLELPQSLRAAETALLFVRGS